MRSLSEIAFRARQEAANLYLLYRRPEFSGPIPAQLDLPNGAVVADALRSSGFAQEVERIAEQLLKHRFPLLGLELETGPEIHWRRDYRHGKESGQDYFKRIPYLDFEQVGDHKLVWELNRHQHLVLLAQAYLITGRREFLEELWTQLTSWLEQNPFQRGINWASALEVAFRALSWTWVWHLVGAHMPEGLKRQFLSRLYQHGRHLAENLSVYFSPNTHLLGEAVALFALGRLFPAFPGADGWRRRGGKIVLEQLAFQMRPDGSHFEQSTYYHVYAVDFFLLFAVLSGEWEMLRPGLERMAEYLFWLLGPEREISFFGDDDGGRLFHPFGKRARFGRATLATCGVLLQRREWVGDREDLAEQAAWWLGAEVLTQAETTPCVARGCRAFEDAGTVFLEAGTFWLQMDCGPFGFGGAGHSHSDSLSVVLWRSGRRVLVDPGTFTYISDIEQRNWFRGSGAHSAVRIDGLEQARPMGPFRWAGRPTVELEQWGQAGDGYFVVARCEYGGFCHRRRLLLTSETLLVLDEMAGPAGEHRCEQTWPMGDGLEEWTITASAPLREVESWWSPAYGCKERGRALVAELRGALPARIAMLLSAGTGVPISVAEAENRLSVAQSGITAAVESLS